MKRMSPIECGEYQKRKRGQIARRIRNRRDLSEAQERLAIQMADRHGVPDDLAYVYLDWYYAFYKRWISLEQMEQETGKSVVLAFPEENAGEGL